VQCFISMDNVWNGNISSKLQSFPDRKYNTIRFGVFVSDLQIVSNTCSVIQTQKTQLTFVKPGGRVGLWCSAISGCEVFRQQQQQNTVIH
jgi:hypothetical protein